MEERAKAIRRGFGLGAAGFLVLGVFAVWQWVASEPLEIPSSLHAGEHISREFTARQNHLYLVGIEIQKALPFDESNCLLGISEPPDPPCGSVRPMVAEWTLQNRGKVIARGSDSDRHSGSWGNDSIQCVLGTFRATAGENYVLDMHFVEGADQLAAAHPRVKVSLAGTPGSVIAEGIGVLMIFAALEGAGLAVILSHVRRGPAI